MNMMRRLYTIKNNKRLYFNGTLIDDNAGTYDVDWNWTPNKQEALEIHLTDAWSFLMLTRREFEGIPFELDRT